MGGQDASCRIQDPGCGLNTDYWWSDPIRWVSQEIAGLAGQIATLDWYATVINYPAMFTFLIAFTLPAPSLVLGWLLFSCLGMLAVGYGKMKEEWPPAALGVAMMVYPYFIPSGLAFWGIGIALTVLLFLPKRVLGW